VSVFDRFRAQHTEESTGYEARAIDTDLAAALAGNVQRSAVTVRPNKDNGGIEAMDEVLEALHTVETDSPRFRGTQTNVSPAHAFEMRYAAPTPRSERVVTLQYLPGSDALAGTLRRQLQTQYPDSQVDETDATFLPGVDVDEHDRYVAGARLALRRYCLYPLKNVDLPGFRTDPTGSILEEMVGTQEEGAADADVAVQIMFKPADREWTRGVANGYGVANDGDTADAPSIGALSHTLTQPGYEKHRLPIGNLPVLGVITRFIPGVGHEVIERDPSAVDRQVATLLEEQQGEKGWRLCLRVVAISNDSDEAITRASKTAGMFRNFYESTTEQTFAPQPLAGEDLGAMLERAGRREFVDSGMVKAQREVAGLVNVPEADHVSTNKLRWSLSTPGEGIPPQTPRFDFDAHDVDDGSDAEKQLAMLDTDDPDAPYWFGFGRKHGVEAGVTAETLNTHTFVGGGTGKGKTTFLTNLVSQIMQRGHGALVFDPKGVDADAFIREWPADRDPEDFVFVDLSDDFDKQVRFNFLEVPTDAPPDSRAFSSAVEALCDDLVAMMAQVGGDDQYWGALMNRVARTLIRGMTKSERTCTLLDLACCCAAPENRAQFHEWMSEERIHFIEEAARRIRMKEEEDLEPLAGRLDQWIQNDAVRNLISATESTVSLQDVVEEGKVVVVRNAPTSGETEKRLFATALIRRAWVAARESTDTPPFYVVCDEFDSIVTTQSNIHSILSEARAFDFCLTLACQNPSNQLPDRVAQAIANQCETFITYNPGGQRDAKLIQAQHSPDVDWEDLTNLSKYRFYMRTHDSEDELTHSYKVDAFPPAAEVRREVTGEAGMTDEDLRWFKRRSIARNGTERPTAMQQKGQSHFYDIDYEQGSSTGLVAEPDEPSDTPRIPATEERRQHVCKALYDEALQSGGGDRYVAANACVERITEYLDIAVEHRSQLWALVDDIPEEYVESETRDDGVYLRCTRAGATAIFQTGAAANSGGPGHRELLRDVYAPLTALGARIDLPEQTGETQPDGVGTLVDIQTPPETSTSTPLRERREATEEAFERFVEDNPILAALTDGGTFHLEAESSTGATKPARTLHNLAQAANQDRNCIFVCRPSTAPAIWETLTDPPFCTTHGMEGSQRFYNHRDLRIDGDLMLRPAIGDQSVWTQDENGEYRLSDGAGEELARFPTAEAVFDDPSRYPATSATVDPEDDDWVPVKNPFVPEHAFDGTPPSNDDWHIVVVPPDVSAPEDLGLFRDGETIPFSDVDTFRDGPVTIGAEQDESEDTEASDGQPTNDQTGVSEDDPEGAQSDTDDSTRFRRF
jgi:hypothetical protein